MQKRRNEILIVFILKLVCCMEKLAKTARVFKETFSLKCYEPLLDFGKCRLLEKWHLLFRLQPTLIVALGLQL